MRTPRFRKLGKNFFKKKNPTKKKPTRKKVPPPGYWKGGAPPPNTRSLLRFSCSARRAFSPSFQAGGGGGGTKEKYKHVPFNTRLVFRKGRFLNLFFFQGPVGWGLNFGPARGIFCQAPTKGNFSGGGGGGGGTKRGAPIPRAFFFGSGLFFVVCFANQQKNTPPPKTKDLKFVSFRIFTRNLLFFGPKILELEKAIWGVSVCFSNGGEKTWPLKKKKPLFLRGLEFFFFFYGIFFEKKKGGAGGGGGGGNGFFPKIFVIGSRTMLGFWEKKTPFFVWRWKKGKFPQKGGVRGH